MNIINTGIAAHVDAGKTTLAEQLLLHSGAIRNAGSVDKGNAHTDFLDVEKQRGISVKAASVLIKWNENNINLIDTPGHMDFAAEVERSLRVLDSVVLLVSAVEGVQSQTENIWKALAYLNIPVIIFINKTDRLGADVARVTADINERFGISAINFDSVNFSIPFDSDTKKFLLEYTAESSDKLLEAYVNDEVELADDEEILRALKEIFCKRYLFPVISGCAIKSEGVIKLLDMIASLCPFAGGNPQGELSAVVFKLEHSKTLGRVAHMRLYSGSVQNRDSIHNYTKDIDEKIVQIKINQGARFVDAGKLHAGEIGAVYGINNSRIGDIFGNPEYIPQIYTMATPMYKVKVFPSDESQYPALVEAFSELEAEDPLLNVLWVKEQRELLISIVGVIQLEILEALIKERFNLDVTFSNPTIIYKETPSKEGIGFESYTMPKPCWAVLKFLMEPGPRGSGVEYKSTVNFGQILQRYQSHVEKVLPDCLRQGPLGWEVTDIKITLIDGEHHYIHTHPLDFYLATPMAIMNGLVNTGTTLLEPFLAFRVSAPQETVSKIIGKVINLRGEFDTPVMKNGTVTVEGIFPAATSMDFPTWLASISQGRGMITTSFAMYRECPLELGATTPYRGINPIDREKYILHARHAL